MLPPPAVSHCSLISAAMLPPLCMSPCLPYQASSLMPYSLLQGTVDAECCEGHAPATHPDSSHSSTHPTNSHPHASHNHSLSEELQQRVQALVVPASPSHTDSSNSSNGGEEGGGHLQPVAARGRRRFHARAARAATPAAAAPQFFGLVAQQLQPGTMGGAGIHGVLPGPAATYVLKLATAHPEAPGASGACTCTHYTLTPVHPGQSLYCQLQNVWLAL